MIIGLVFDVGTVKLNEVCVPEGDLAVVVLILDVILVPGYSTFATNGFITSIIEFSELLTSLPPNFSLVNRSDDQSVVNS